ncbi:MAG TPA: hypothetical protein VFB12_18755 [Ktedonobacteraceae bacterium]|nr:hypothetical protein [Ktedonobacteraceae bacterium]
MAQATEKPAAPRFKKAWHAAGVRHRFLQGDIQAQENMVRCQHLQEEGKVEEVMNQQDWEKKSREILTDIREWRQAHRHPQPLCRLKTRCIDA